VFRFLHAAMALLFLFGAIVQYNDPDPLRWIAIYVAAAVACALAAAKRLPRWLPLVVLAIALIWAITLAPRAFPNVRILEMFAAWEMANQRIEEAREMYGLLLIAIYMGVLAIARPRAA
jgi:hypothetical protein